MSLLIVAHVGGDVDACLVLLKGLCGCLSIVKVNHSLLLLACEALPCLQGSWPYFNEGDMV